MNQQAINLLAEVACYANDQALTEWLEMLLPKDRVAQMDRAEKLNYLESLKRKN